MIKIGQIKILLIYLLVKVGNIMCAVIRWLRRGLLGTQELIARAMLWLAEKV